MPANLSFQLIFTLALLQLSPVVAGETSDSAAPDKSINVTIEVLGFEVSARLLKDASLDLAKKISQIDPNPENMTPEQIQAITALIREANHLVQSFDQSNELAEQAIKRLRDPTLVLMSDALKTLHQSSIEPAIQSADDAVTRWLIVTFSGLIILLGIAGYYFYAATRQIRSMAQTLKSITSDYEIVPKRTSQEINETDSPEAS